MADLKKELSDLGELRVEQAKQIAGDRAAVVLALGSRATGLKNAKGGGVWQLSGDDHRLFLLSARGCRAGSWTPETFYTALGDGYVPQFRTACAHVVETLRDLEELGLEHDVAAQDLERFAIVAFGAGVEDALRGYVEEKSWDRYTDGGRYSADVLERAEKIGKLIA